MFGMGQESNSTASHLAQIGFYWLESRGEQQTGHSRGMK